MITQNIKKGKNLYKNLGPVGARLITELRRQNRPVFTVQEASEILGGNCARVWKLCHDLAEKGWLQRIEKGKYFVIPFETDASKPYTENQFLIASKLITPYYIGFWSMLNYYGYTEQLVNTVFIASPKRKKNLKLLGVEYKFIKTSPAKMFGLTNIKINGTSITVSDKERTLIDCLDHPEYCGGIIETAKGIWNAREEINFTKILNYVRKIENSAVAKRLGYLIELLELSARFDINQIRSSIATGYSLLDPLIPRKGKFNSKWNLVVNVPEEELLAFRKT